MTRFPWRKWVTIVCIAALGLGVCMLSVSCATGSGQSAPRRLDAVDYADPPHGPRPDLAANRPLLDAEHHPQHGSRLAEVGVQTPHVDVAKNLGLAKSSPQPHHRGALGHPGPVPRPLAEKQSGPPQETFGRPSCAMRRETDMIHLPSAPLLAKTAFAAN